jgi:hypothetical protein
MMMLKKIALWTIVLLLPTFLLAWVIKSGFTKTDKAALSKQKEDAWINEKWASMTENERIGQLFMVAAYPNKGAEDEAIVKELIEKYHVGGLIMFYSGPAKAASLINYYQSLSKKVPLMVSVDGEWGLNMRMDSVMAFPRQILMGAIQDNRLIYDFGKEVARQCRRVGIHINFAPVVDVNNNPSNPVIGDRSFGENKENVTAKAFQYMMGMQDNEGLVYLGSPGCRRVPNLGDGFHAAINPINDNTCYIASYNLDVKKSTYRQFCDSSCGRSRRINT